MKEWMLPMLLLALAPGVLRAEAEGQTRWNLAMFTWVHRVPAEAGAEPNDHPATLGDEAIRAALAPVKARVEGKDVPLLGKDELKEIAPALRQAFALAGPGEDLILLATSRHGGGILQRPEGVTARLFVRGGALNLIVHDTRREFLDQYQADNLQPKFTYGSRKAASRETVQAESAQRLRGDWLAFPLAPVAVIAAPVAPVAPAVPVTPTIPVVAAPVPPALPPPAPTAPAKAAPAAQATAPKAASEPAPAAKDDAAYEAQAQRLRTLKRLRDENLISEAEYQERRQAILKAL